MPTATASEFASTKGAESGEIERRIEQRSRGADESLGRFGEENAFLCAQLKIVVIMPVRRGHVAPQNTFLGIIIRKFEGQSK